MDVSLSAVEKFIAFNNYLKGPIITVMKNDLWVITK